MPRPDRRRLLVTVLALIAGLLLVSGCSRLTFVRQNFERKGFDQTARDVEVSDRAVDRGDASVRRHVILAADRLGRGDLAGARREAELALKQDPASADAHTLLAAALEAGGDGVGAGNHYRRAADLAPTSGAALNNYGAWMCAQGRQAESLAWFDRALAAPGYANPATALANSGACADQAGQGERARRELRRAIELDPTNAVALGALAEHELRAGRAFEARAFSERRLAAAPADRRSLLIASQIEEKLGDTRAAGRYVQRMRAEFPDTRDSGTGDNGKP